jgi:hypothetical protein
LSWAEAKYIDYIGGDVTAKPGECVETDFVPETIVDNPACFVLYSEPGCTGMPDILNRNDERQWGKDSDKKFRISVVKSAKLCN